ncbi:MAG: tetratricopeptide repeat protein [Endomicrobium sp.]|jgi:tetratricopeptide (TPR) repeat protein|nr:tetratricopeptide repeat protein [Endomicrobium sp.]
MNFTAQNKSVREIISEIILKLFENKIKLFTVMVLSAVIIFTALFIFWRSNTADRASSEKFWEACVFFDSGDSIRAITSVDEVISRFSKTPASYQARLLKADILISRLKYDEAIKILKEILDTGKPNAIKPLASSEIIYVYDSKRDYPAAILASNEFIKKYPNHFLVKDIYLNLAEYYFLSGLKEDAVRVFNEVLVKFPATPEAQKARDRLDYINKINKGN